MKTKFILCIMLFSSIVFTANSGEIAYYIGRNWMFVASSSDSMYYIDPTTVVDVSKGEYKCITFVTKTSHEYGNVYETIYVNISETVWVVNGGSGIQHNTIFNTFMKIDPYQVKVPEGSILQEVIRRALKCKIR